MRHYRATRALNFESLAISHAEKCYGVLCALAAILQRLINRRTLPLLAFAHLHSCTFSPYAQTRFSRAEAFSKRLWRKLGSFCWARQASLPALISIRLRLIIIPPQLKAARVFSIRRKRLNVPAASMKMLVLVRLVFMLKSDSSMISFL